MTARESKTKQTHVALQFGTQHLSTVTNCITLLYYFKWKIIYMTITDNSKLLVFFIAVRYDII